MALALQRSPRRAKAVQGQNTQAVGTPAPVRGLMANTAIYGGGEGTGGKNPHEFAIYLYNLVPRELGCTVRKGSKEIATNIPDATASPGEVRTHAYYNSQVSQGAGGQDFEFAFTDAGIFDITAGGAGPWVPVLAWPSTGGNAGWVSTQNFTNDAGTHYLLICDEDNGYYTFDGTTWVQGTFSGPGPAPDPADCVHVTSWQNRLFFVERDTTIAWYTDPGSFLGDVTPIDFGTRFIKGGHLVSTASWTMDDGAGMDDKFVCVSSSGDLLVFSGFDPDNAANWFMQGIWYVGQIPEGRRCFSDWGGNLIVISSMGVLTLSALLGGMASVDEDSYVTKNISRFFQQEMSTKVEEWGWQLELNPRDDLAIISVPVSPLQEDQRPIQFALNLNTSAWTILRDLDMLCMNKSNVGFRFGTRDGRVMNMEGAADNQSLDGLTSDTIVYSMLTHYSHMGMPANWKRPQFIRPSFIGRGRPIYGVQVRFDFDLTEIGTNPPYIATDISRWDFAVWDQNTWGQLAQSYIAIVGLNGMGRHLAIALRGETATELSLIGFDLMLDQGGML